MLLHHQQRQTDRYINIKTHLNRIEKTKRDLLLKTTSDGKQFCVMMAVLGGGCPGS